MIFQEIIRSILRIKDILDSPLQQNVQESKSEYNQHAVRRTYDCHKMSPLKRTVLSGWARIWTFCFVCTTTNTDSYPNSSLTFCWNCSVGSFGVRHSSITFVF